MWIDRIVELVPRERMVAIKNISLAEDHLHDHFPSMPVMPASLIIEGMAQTAGILVGHAEEFREKVILAKVGLAEFDREAIPGTTLRYTATLRQMDRQGAATEGIVELIDHAARGGGAGAGGQPVRIGRVDLMFSHIDQNMAGMEFPEDNFVFGDSFKLLLKMSGIAVGPAR